MSETLIQRRARLLGPNMSTFYDEPVHLVRGQGVHLWDADGRQYLDCYNNVPHVGHCHPRVVSAICEQAGTLNTHTRYLHEGILDYVEALTATFDVPFDTALLCCTGSEANDVALRMAQALTGKTGVIATDHTYHGNTTAVHQLSRTNAPPGGYWDSVRFVPAPDSYRPLGGVAGMPHAHAFAAEVQAQIDALEAAGHGFSTLMLCPFFANEGFPDLPHGWLDPVQEVVRNAGGVKVSPDLISGTLMSFAGIRDAAALGIDYPDRPTEICAAVVTPQPIDAPALLEACRRILLGRAPHRIVRVEQIPRNQMGKVMLRELRQLVG